MEKSAIFRFQFSNIYNFSYLEIISQKPSKQEWQWEILYKIMTTLHKAWKHRNRGTRNWHWKKKSYLFLFLFGKNWADKSHARRYFCLAEWSGICLHISVRMESLGHNKIICINSKDSEKIFMNLCSCCHWNFFLNKRERKRPKNEKKAILRAAQQKHLHLTFWRCSTVWMSFSSLSEVSESVTRWGHIQPRRSIKIWGQLQSSFQHWNHFSAKKKKERERV